MQIKSKSYFIINGKPVDGEGNSLLLEDSVLRIRKSIKKLNDELDAILARHIEENPEDADEILEKYGYGEVDFDEAGTIVPKKKQYEADLEFLKEHGVEVKGRPSKVWVAEQLAALEKE